MQITVKVKRRGAQKAASVVRDRLKHVHPEAAIEEVFPGVQSGRRAGMVSINLPDTLSKDDSEAILRTLRDDEEIEYAEPAAPRRAKK